MLSLKCRTALASRKTYSCSEAETATPDSWHVCQSRANVMSVKHSVSASRAATCSISSAATIFGVSSTMPPGVMTVCCGSPGSGVVGIWCSRV
ncbi:MAG: hypothetical protein IRZ28_14395 [Steroidobacteraceae bacterium]|nr:hypothetical protein [Steroidobacteraceae bacterium]